MYSSLLAAGDNGWREAGNDGGCDTRYGSFRKGLMDKDERKALWWLIKWALFWILILMLFGVPILVF